MFIRAMVSECDRTGEKFETPVEGFHCLARGTTGRVCCVLYLGPNSGVKPEQAKTYEEALAWAESVPGGYLDY